jgi:hypothetical protein
VRDARFGVGAAAGILIAGDGRMRSRSAVITPLLLALCLATPARAQTEPNERNVRDLFAGQKMLVTWRDGGPLYGTFFTLQVHFCNSGRYMTFGESRRQTVLDNQQVSNLDDRGSWNVTTFQGQLVLRYLSDSGQANAVPVRVLPNGNIWVGEGVTVIRQGAAQCR